MRAFERARVPLEGTRLIEASAGTGKTQAIADLYLRLLAERRLEPARVLVVTYTRAATAELRERIRARLRDALAALEGGSADEAMQSVLDAWSSRPEGPPDPSHLRACLYAMDEASVFTIHAFCQRVLRQNAFECGVPFDVELLQDPRPVLDEIARDFWVSELSDASEMVIRYVREHARLGPDALVKLALRLAGHACAELVPERAVDRPEPDLASWRQDRERVAKLWAAHAGELVQRLSRSTSLKKNIYHPARVQRWAGELDLALADEQMPLSWSVKRFDRLTASGLADGAKRGAAPPQHPFFEACEALFQAEQEMDGLLRARVLDLQLRFADHAHLELEARLERAGLETFDALLGRLHAALVGDSSAHVATRIRELYAAALIDEFQDTDPVQYEIFKRIFHDAGLPLLLIGDPKQAIYSFRGADVFAYLEARADAGERVYVMETNHRSDPGLIRATNALFGADALPFRSPEIGFSPAHPAPGREDAFRGGAPLQFLLAPREPGRPHVANDVRRELPQLVSAEIARTLASGAAIGDEPVHPGDIAVLCRRNDQAFQLQDALRELGIPAVLQGDTSVFETEEADDLEHVLRALARPVEAGELRAALATRLLGATAGDLIRLEQDEPEWDRWVNDFQGWHRLWLERGVFPALRALMDTRGNAARLLRQLGGERSLTNLLHLAELLHTAERQLRLGPLALVRWLVRMRGDDAARAAQLGEDAQIRLESDARAVQLTTLHRSKGLQYPIVYLPWAWQPSRLSEDERRWVRFHDRADGGRLKFDVGSGALERHVRLAEAEAQAESSRLLYVGITRAVHRCCLVWGAFKGADASALAHLLGGVPATDQLLRQRLEAIAQASGGQIEMRALPREATVARRERARARVELAPRPLTREIEGRRRTSSFSGLVSARVRLGDPRDLDAGVADVAGEVRGELTQNRVVLADFPRGARAGSLLHEVYERIDFAAADARCVGAEVDQALARHGFDAVWREALVRDVLDTLDQPLDEGGSLRLREIPRARRVDELEFLVPVSERAEAWLEPGRLAAVYRAHADPALARDYAPRLAGLRFAALAGYLRGFVDLVFERDGRWYLADYKSNHLGDRPEHYAPERLREPMLAHHYLLQSHIYGAALHRYLSFRVPDYDYERCFGGIYYLFLRGMAPGQPPGWGVYAQRPPRRLIEGLSTALAGGGEVAA